MYSDMVLICPWVAEWDLGILLLTSVYHAYVIIFYVFHNAKKVEKTFSTTYGADQNYIHAPIL